MKSDTREIQTHVKSLVRAQKAKMNLENQSNVDENYNISSSTQAVDPEKEKDQIKSTNPNSSQIQQENGDSHEAKILEGEKYFI